MRLLSPRLLIPCAVVVAAWGGLHVLSAHNLAVVPASWPSATQAPAAAPSVGVAVASPSASAAPSGLAAIPILPGALAQLNGSTRDTAVGLYTLIQDLEGALRTHLEQLAQQLEPGR